jgi:acyl-CoA thioester hydrolase
VPDAALLGPPPAPMRWPVRAFRCPVEPGWLDYNRHVNDAAYAVVFSRANETVIDALGLGAGYARASGRALFTVEARLRYLAAVAADGEFAARTVVAQADTKRLRLRTRLYDVSAGGGGQVVADGDHLYLHVDRELGRVVPFPGATTVLLDGALAAVGPDEPPDHW